MSKARVKAAKTMPSKTRRAQTRRKAALPAPLPLQANPAATTSLLPIEKAPVVSKKADRSHLPSNSLVRQKVLAIIAARLAGKSNEEIAAQLGIKETSVHQYMYLAGKHGWLHKHAVNPNDRLEYEVAQKVVRNLDEMLDSTNEDRRDLATLKTAEGMLFKKFQAEQVQMAPMAVIGVRIEMPNIGTPATIREGTTGGEPLWKEGEVVNDAKQG